jgi:monoamine oxidase
MVRSIIIIGAGASGLQAGRRLSEAGHRVTLLEAAAQPGGRILSLTPEGFSTPVEGGAEFVHGCLPLTLGLMKEAGVVLQPVNAELVRRAVNAEGVRRTGEEEPAPGSFVGEEEPAPGSFVGEEESAPGSVVGEEESAPGSVMGADWSALMEAMAGLQEDLPIGEFLATHFGAPRFAALRESVRRFAEGYDLADMDRASTLALHREWSAEEEEEEWRPVGGYGGMIDFLAAECRRQGATLHCSAPVVEARWAKGQVTVRTAGGQVFTGDTLIVSVSLGVLAQDGIRFVPALPEGKDPLRQLGFGSVIKILLEFRQAFWLDKKPVGRTLFLLSDQPVPTWWTQTDEDSRLLTGWLAGERMRRFQALGEAARLESCLRSVAAIFSKPLEWLRGELAASCLADWSERPFVRGGYSFETVDAARARARLSRPIGQTVYFCGEALYEGVAPGTVEAALQSGRDVAESIIHRLAY